MKKIFEDPKFILINFLDSYVIVTSGEDPDEGDIIIIPKKLG